MSRISMKKELSNRFKQLPNWLQQALLGFVFVYSSAVVLYFLISRLFLTSKESNATNLDFDNLEQVGSLSNYLPISTLVESVSSALTHFLTDKAAMGFASFLIASQATRSNPSLISTATSAVALSSFFQGVVGQGTEVPNISNATVSPLTFNGTISMIIGSGPDALWHTNERYVFANIRTGTGAVAVITIDDIDKQYLAWWQAPNDLRGIGKITGLTNNQSLFTISSDLKNSFINIKDIRDPFNSKTIGNYSVAYANPAESIISPDNNYIFFGFDFGILVVDAFSGKNISTLITSYPVRKLLFNHNGTILCVAMTTNLLIVNVANSSALQIINTIPYNNPQKISASSSDVLLVSYLARLGELPGVDFFSFDSQTRLGRLSINCVIYDISTLSEYAFLACNQNITTVSFVNPRLPSQLDSLVADTSQNGRVSVINLSSGNRFLRAITGSIIRIYSVSLSALQTLSPTFAPLTIMPPPPPTPLPLTNAPETPIPLTPAPQTAIPATPAPITPLPTTAVPAPIVTLPPKQTPVPLPPGQTASPNNVALHFNATVNGKVEITGVVPNRAVTVLVGVNPAIAVYMQGSAGASKYDPISGNVEIVASSQNDANTKLSAMRFSSNPNNPNHNETFYNQTTVELFASQLGIEPIWGAALLSNFGSNTAPELNSNVTLLSMLVNQTVQLDSDFSVRFGQIFTDLNRDPFSVTVIPLDREGREMAFPIGTRIRDNIMSGTCSWLGSQIFKAQANDNYLNSPLVYLILTCQYNSPAVIGKIANMLDVKPNIKSEIDISWSDIFSGTIKSVVALVNGDVLPNGLSFKTIAPGFSRFSVTTHFDATYNITVIGYGRFSDPANDPLKDSANTTFRVISYDYPPQIQRNISNIVAEPLKETIVNLVGTITDPDDPISALTTRIITGAGGIIASVGATFDPTNWMFAIIPSQSMIGGLFNFTFQVTDPTQKSTQLSFNMQVLKPQAPIPNAPIQNITGAPGTVTFVIPSNAFNSSYLAQLILTAELLTSNGAAPLPDGSQLASQHGIAYGNSLSMPLSTGITRVRFNVTDPFGNIASQVAQANLSTSLVENIWLIVGILSGATGITAVAQYFQLFVGILNAMKLTWYSRPCAEKPFSNRDDTYQIMGLDGTDLTVYYYKRINFLTLNIIKIPFALILVLASAPFLFTTAKHAIEQLLTLSEIGQPNWILFDLKTNTFTIMRDLIPDDERLIEMRAYKPNDMLAGAFGINAKDFHPPVFNSSSTAPLLSDFFRSRDERSDCSDGNESGDAPTLSPLSSSSSSLHNGASKWAARNQEFDALEMMVSRPTKRDLRH